MSKPNIYIEDAVNFAARFDGAPYHAILCDPPYNLDTISKRFGKPGSVPAKYGRDGAFQRASRGFMGQSWDTDIAFQSKTWASFRHLLYPGAFGIAFAGARTYHHMASAIEEAGFIIHPMLGWVYASGMPHATKIRTDHEAWSGYRYGLGAQKPALEPICLFQKPFYRSPIENIMDTGAGALNIDGTRIPSDPFVINRFLDGAKPFGGGAGHKYETTMETKGRWPANFIGGDYPYFFQPKPNAKERDYGLDAKNPHAAIKPISLTTYLATLLLPPTIYAPRRLFNPFSGTGSEAIGAGLAGWEVVDAIEVDPLYAKTAQRRVDAWCSDR